MTLSQEQAALIIKRNPNKDAIQYKRKKHELYKAHVTGIGSDDLIKPIKAYERKQYLQDRKQLALSNKDVIARTMQPMNKIYSAKGGIESYNLRTPKQVEQFKIFVANCRGRQSLKQYIKQEIQPKFFYDMEGLAWIDLDENGNPFPTFKSIMQIYDYEVKGRTPEYVVFNLTKKEIEQLDIRAKGLSVDFQGRLITPPSQGDSQTVYSKFFRVVCDSYDRIYQFVNGSSMPTLVSEIPNPFAFMGVPGLVVSDIPAEPTPSEDFAYDSLLAPSIELLNHLVFQRSLFNVTFARVAYPKEWMQKMPCPTCNGDKVIASGDCPECKGTGALPMQKHSDVLIVDYTADINKSMPNPPMGVVPAPIEALQYMHDENASLEDVIRYTQWGVLTNRSNGERIPAGTGGNVSGTAFEANMNNQPLYDKQAECSTWASSIYKFYTDGCGMYLFNQDYYDSAIMFGDRFMNESSDVTFERLLKARTGGATKSELLSLTMEYLENKYSRNPIEYRRYKILAIAEPFYHDSIREVITWNIPEINKLEKIWFDDWAATLTNDYFATLPDDGLEPRVKQDLRNYVLTRAQIDNTADTLLFAASGDMMNVGDNVTVEGVNAQVSAIMGRHIKLSNGAIYDRKLLTKIK
jgi:hypothetical protein